MQIVKKNLHSGDLGFMSKNQVGAIKELYKNVVIICYKLKMFRIYDIRSGHILYNHSKSEFKKDPFKASSFDYQNAICLGNSQILFIEQTRDDKSTVYEIERLGNKGKGRDKNLVPPLDKKSSRIECKLKVVNFLPLAQMIDVFPAESTIVLKTGEICSGSRYSQLKYFANQR